MKRVFSIAVASILVMSFTSCSEMETASDPYCAPATIGLTRSQETVAYGQVSFDLELFKRMVSKTDDDNLVISPFSMATVFSLAASAAAGSTYDDIAKTLGFENCSSSEIGSYYSKALQAMVPTSDTCKISFANSVWLHEGHLEICQEVEGYKQRYEEFKDEIATYYAAEIIEHPLDDKITAQMANDWIKAKTYGMIKNFSDDFKFNNEVFMMNAVYFKSEWLYSSRYISRPNIGFTDWKGNESNRNFFTGDAYGARAYNLKCDCASNDADEPQILCLAYKSCGLNMLFLLPPDEVGIDDFIASMNVNSWNRWMSSLKESDIYTSFEIPEFEEESFKNPQDWTEALWSMGMGRAFSNGADFPIFPSMCIGKALQKTKIEVNSKGTKAAAVSYVDYTWGSSGRELPPQYSFKARSPFIYALVEPETQSILFMGVIRK